MGPDVGRDGAHEEQDEADCGGDAERGYAMPIHSPSAPAILRTASGKSAGRGTPTLVMFSMSHAGRRKSTVAAVPFAAAVRMPTAT